MKPIISVIIPVYKVEHYLPKCVESLCNQTFRDLEIILVDDGSPDNSGRICDEYAAKDSRIRVIHKENGGVSSARNAGLDASRGELVGFVDSDDWADPDMYQFLYDNLVGADADISVCGAYEHMGEAVTPLGDPSICVAQSGQDAVRTFLQLTVSGNALWNKLFRKRLFAETRFPEGRIWEDSFVVVQLLDAAKNVVYHMQPKYHYVRRPDSITLRAYRPALRDCVESQTFIYEYIRERYPDLAAKAKQSCIWANLFVLDAMMLSSGPVDEADKKRFIRFLRENRKEIFSDPTFTKARKIALVALGIHESLYKIMVKLQNR